MKISYSITVCNEHKEIEKLLTFLFEHKRKEDQVVVQMDTAATKEVWNACEKFENRPFDEYKLIECALNKNFAAYKNNLNTHNAYKDFRKARAELRQENKTIDGLELAKYLKNYAAIGEKYVTILEGIIENNSLTDFDKANLLPIKLKKGVAL